MNKEIAKEWVDALRSGDYAQGFYQLRSIEDKYDPIGVLCEMAASVGVCERKEHGGKDRVFYGWSYDGLATRLPRAVEEWSGLGYWAANRIITMNDHKAKFPDIANYIEDRYVNDS